MTQGDKMKKSIFGLFESRSKVVGNDSNGVDKRRCYQAVALTQAEIEEIARREIERRKKQK